MKKWEYFETDKEIILETGKKIFKGWGEGTENKFDLMMNKYGELGWELITVQNERYYFKRELKKK
jgi:hypothetical protein